jgi:hypothetical protein
LSIGNDSVGNCSKWPVSTDIFPSTPHDYEVDCLSLCHFQNRFGRMTNGNIKLDFQFSGVRSSLHPVETTFEELASGLEQRCHLRANGWFRRPRYEENVDFALVSFSEFKRQCVSLLRSYGAIKRRQDLAKHVVFPSQRIGRNLLITPSSTSGTRSGGGCARRRGLPRSADRCRRR